MHQDCDTADHMYYVQHVMYEASTKRNKCGVKGFKLEDVRRPFPQLPLAAGRVHWELAARLACETFSFPSRAFLHRMGSTGRGSNRLLIISVC